jgi:predicted glycosyltransferase
MLRRVVVSFGGGSELAGSAFRDQSAAALDRIAFALDELHSLGRIAESLVILPFGMRRLRVSATESFSIAEEAVEFIDAALAASAVVVRAGRNAVGEIAHYGVPGVVVPIDGDPLRGFEQHNNAIAASRYSFLRVMRASEVTALSLEENLLLARDSAHTAMPQRGPSTAHAVAQRLVRLVQEAQEVGAT